MPTEVSTELLTQMLARQKRTEAHYRNAMRKALTEILHIMNPGDEASYPQDYPGLVDYALDFLSTEAAEVGALTRAPQTEESQGGLSLDE